MTEAPDILRKIVQYKQEELARRLDAVPRPEMVRRAAQCQEPTRGFCNSLRVTTEAGGTAVIAEVKKGSPSKGIIRDDFDPLRIAKIYQDNGATCLSVLTDEHFFLGHLAFLSQIRKECALPLLRKDFIFDEYQIHEARAGGVDAILLIAAMLGLSQLRDFAAVAAEFDLDVLLEVHDEAELEMALQTDVTLIGINNRNLRSFVTDLGTTERLAALLPADRLLVSESGIATRADITRLSAAGARAFLVGESLMREADIGAKLRSLLGT
jgi:indole-3-glycerol phosphate synthase